MNHNVRVWLHGLISAVMGGAYIGVVSLGADQVGGWEIDTSRALVLAGWSAMSHAVAYLKKSPLPLDEEDIAALKAAANRGSV
jgi:hypothetical protein